MTHIPPSWNVQPMASALGAEIHGADLRHTNLETLRAVRTLLHQYQVIFFRDQDITPAQQKEIAAHFGPLQTHPAYPTVPNHPEVTILHHTSQKPSKIEQWHTDMTFRPHPPLGSLLHAQMMPPVGGDTLWASMSAAYEGLSDALQRFLSGLSAVHSFAQGFRESLSEPGGYERLRGALADNPPLQHPVVRKHPETGKLGIFVNCLFTTHIVGMKPAESRALLSFLYTHCTQPEYTCRFRWHHHSLAFWDNRIPQHKPINDYWPAERKMHRVVIEGDRPSGP